MVKILSAVIATLVMSSICAFSLYDSSHNGDKATLAPSQVLLNSPVTTAHLRNRRVHFKRDDLLSLPHVELTGNKARKLYGMTLLNQFPAHIASCGGYQGNAMVALARLAKHKNSQLTYFTSQIPEAVKSNPAGNYRAALDMGMKVVTVSRKMLHRLQLIKFNDMSSVAQIIGAGSSFADSFWIPQGVSMPLAEPGIALLAKELAEYMRGTRRWKIAVEGGTGGTAYLLHRHIKSLCGDQAQVICIPCSGDVDNLREHMQRLARECGEGDLESPLPTIITDNKRRVFAQPSNEHYEIWQEITSTTGIRFDLIYAPRAWEVLWDWLPTQKDEFELMYLCTGGAEGTDTQLSRYKSLGILGTLNTPS